MTYEEAVGYLDGLGEARIEPGLERIREALARLGDPHRRFPHLAVGGTNGKGSTVAFLSSILSAAGHRVGMYTSPHLVRFEERIRVGDELLPAGDLARLADEVRGTGIHLSYFEAATAIALLHFARRDVEVGVLEVGMGGRWDAVNATDPIVSVITTISRDHTRWLGETEEAIAREKAPIMRPWAPVVIGRIGGRALDALLAEGEALRARVVRWGRDFICGDGAAFSYRGQGWRMDRLSLGLPGSFQADNAACALAAAELLDREGICVPEQAARAGLAAARWPARFQTFPGTPPVILDVAHNPAGIAALLASLGGGPPPAWVFSALADKEIEEMARLLAPSASRVVLVPLSHPRAADLGRLTSAFAPLCAGWEPAGTVEAALARARDAAGPGGRVVVAGSSYLAGAALSLLEGGEKA